MSHAKTVKIKDGDDFRIINESDFKQDQHELCEGEKLSTDSVIVNLKVGITPELQTVIDDAKAECEKATDENVGLKEQLAIAHGELIAFKHDVSAMKARITELESVDYSKFKVDELKDVLKLKGIEFPSDAKKDDLLALIPKE
jgi:hypothetical protein